MNQIILQGITLNELINAIENILEEKLNAKCPMKKAGEDIFLTRKEVAVMHRITLPTLHDYTKIGILPSYKIGTRVLYKKTEVLAALNNIAAVKHKKGILR